jgi:hypothetical protein
MKKNTDSLLIGLLGIFGAGIAILFLLYQAINKWNGVLPQAIGEQSLINVLGGTR